MAERTMRKGEFAELIGVSAGRISQYLDSGIIGQDALVGEGRYARIRVNLAIEQIRARRDPGQATGLNGIRTRLERVPDEEMVPRGNHSSSTVAAMLASHADDADDPATIVAAVIARHAALPDDEDADPEATKAVVDQIDLAFRDLFRQVWGLIVTAYEGASDDELAAVIQYFFETRFREEAEAIEAEYSAWAEEETARRKAESATTP